MKTKINIGTNLGNIVGVVFDKEFEKISLKNVMDKAKESFGAGKHIKIIGWSKCKK